MGWCDAVVRSVSTGRGAHVLRAGTIAVCVAALLVGCGRLDRKDRANDLNSTAGFYAKAMRWGEFRAALGLMKPLDGGELELEEQVLDELDDVTVVSVDYELTALDEVARTARLYAAYEYHIGDSTRLRNAEQVGVWWFDEDAEAWFLDGPLPDFRR